MSCVFSLDYLTKYQVSLEKKVMSDEFAVIRSALNETMTYNVVLTALAVLIKRLMTGDLGKL